MDGSSAAQVAVGVDVGWLDVDSGLDRNMNCPRPTGKMIMIGAGARFPAPEFLHLLFIDWKHCWGNRQ